MKSDPPRRLGGRSCLKYSLDSGGLTLVRGPWLASKVFMPAGHRNRAPRSTGDCIVVPPATYISGISGRKSPHGRGSVVGAVAIVINGLRQVGRWDGLQVLLAGC